MKPAVCKVCGKAEWNHKCSGSGEVPSIGSMADAVARAEAVRAAIQRAEAVMAPLVTRPVEVPATPVSATPVSATKNKGGRPRKPDAMSAAERMRKARAAKRAFELAAAIAEEDRAVKPIKAPGVSRLIDAGAAERMAKLRAAKAAKRAARLLESEQG